MSEKDNVDSNVKEETVVIIDEEDKSIGNDPLNNTKIIFDGKEVKVKRARNVNQTPYYQQQRIAGQPVYVQGPPPPPINAQRTPMHRVRSDHANGSRGSDSSDDGELMPMFNPTFQEKKIRRRFIKRVYAILSIQLLFTAGYITFCVLTPPVKEFLRKDLIGLIIASILTMIIYFVLVFVQAARRRVPINFILLALFTLCECYAFGVFSCMYSTFIVFTSMGVTAGVCTGVSLLACFVCCDITMCGMVLCAASLIVGIFGIITMILMLFLKISIMFLVYAILIAIVFTAYLIYDTQQLMAGKRIRLSEEEYICGALSLYVDVMQIFWAILAIFGFSFRPV